MIDPVAYEEDCKIVTGGKVIDHKLLSGPERKKHIEMTRDLWNRSYPGEIFYVDLNDPDSPVDPTFKSNLKYVLETAVVNEMVFNYQVALPHYGDEIFLKEAIKRYWFMLMIYMISLILVGTMYGLVTLQVIKSNERVSEGSNQNNPGESSRNRRQRGKNQEHNITR